MKLLPTLLAGVLAFAATAGGERAGLGVGARVARADDEEDAARARARKHFKRGEKLFALGRFADALEQYQAAFEEFPAPEFLFNIGQCHRNLGNLEEAIFSFKKFLKLRPDAPNREAVEEYIAALEEDLAAQNEKRKKPPGAELDPPPPPGGGPGGDPRPGGAPIYKKWWFWGGVAVVGAAVTTFVIVSADDGGLPGSDLGNLEFPR